MRIQQVFIATVGAAAAVVVGGLLTLLGPRFAIAVAGMVFGGFLLVYLNRAVAASRDLLFWVMLGLVPLVTLVLSVVGVRVSFLLELGLLASLFVTVWQLPSLMGRHAIWRVLIMLVATYLAVAAASTLLGRSMAIPAAYQVGTNLKFLMMMLLGAYIAWTPSSERWLFAIVRWAWLPLLLPVLLQLMAPSVYDRLLPFAVDVGRNDILPMSKAPSFLRHPSYLGFYAALLMVFAVVIARTYRQPVYWLSALFYLGLLAASGERHEMLTGILLLVVAIGLSGLRVPPISRLVMLTAAMVVVMGLIAALLWDYFVALSDHMALTGRDAPFQPRSVLYADSVLLAQRYFPLGSGLGTFGSAAAAKFDPRMYFDLGYTGFGWFGTNVLSDTYWPQHLAESGVFGTALLASALVMPALFALYQVFRAPDLRIRTYWLFASLGLALVLSISLASPIIEDPGLSLLPFVLFSVALSLPGQTHSGAERGSHLTSAELARGRASSASKQGTRAQWARPT